MAKKYIAMFYDSRHNPIDAYGPVYGEITDEKFNEVVKVAKRKKADIVVFERRTNGTFITEFAYYVKFGKTVSGKHFLL